MDIAALIGFAGAFVMVFGSMWYAGGIMPFYDLASVFIVIGGTIFSALSTTSVPNFIASFKAMGKAFKTSNLQNDALVKRMVELSALARKDGMMALEGQPVPDKFFEKGLQLLIDGADEAKLVKQLKQEIKSMKSRHESAQGVVKAWVDIGPAMGMIGTLIGLVLMLGNMSDVSSIGPAMAVALLTTLYGAMIANVMFGPLLTKLQGLTSAEVDYRNLIIEGLRGIARGDSPRLIEDQLIAALDPPDQAKLRAAA